MPLPRPPALRSRCERALLGGAAASIVRLGHESELRDPRLLRARHHLGDLLVAGLAIRAQVQLRLRLALGFLGESRVELGRVGAFEPSLDLVSSLDLEELGPLAGREDLSGALCFIAAPSAHATWPHDPYVGSVPVCTQAGEQYASANSFILKADVGKSGATHDH